MRHGHGTWDMGHGTWDMGHGTWDMGHGTWDMGHGTWDMDMGHGTWDMGHGTWDMGHGTWDIYTYEKLSEIKDFLREKVKIEPKIGIICGSGLGHVGKFIFGHIRGTPVTCMQGRFHYYEGYPISICAMPVKLMKLLGISYLIASNAAGGLNQNYKVGECLVLQFFIGDVMLQKDHFNLMGLAGLGPHIGPSDSRFGPRFFSMNNAYDEDILVKTVADVRALISLGVDAVGMSTVHEVIAARQCGISLITNICSMEYSSSTEVHSSSTEVHSEEVLKVAQDMEDELRIFVEKIVEAINKVQ
nr:unnamed protein product [Callosobruchus analis]